MRTKTLLIAAVLSAAGIAAASAQVSSVNAVGYVNKSLTAGLNLIANPLSNGANGIAEVIVGAPSGTSVFKFEGGTFIPSQFAEIPGVGGIWSPEITLPVGDGFFIQVPEDVTITFVGEVLQGTDTNKTIPGGLSIQGSTVPVAGTMTEHGFPAASGDTVFSWNGAGYDPAQFAEIPGVGGVWSPVEPSLGIADSVFVDKAADIAWDRNFTIQ